MNIGELVALLRLDDSEFNSRVDEAGSRFESTAGRMTSAGKTMTANVTAPLVGLGTMAVMAGANFQTSMLKVQAVSGATGAEFDQLSALAKEMGSTTQFSASESADALGFLAMAGFDTNEMMSALPGVLNLAAAGSLDLASAADIASNVLSGYGLEVDQLGRVNDVMAKTASSANVDIAMMGETMKYAAPVAAAAGVEFEETAAMAGLMGNAGIQASQAGTALRGGLSRLLNPTKAVSSTLSALGVNVTDSNGALLPMVDIMGQLEGAGASTADMMKIFGVEAGPAFMAVMSQGSGTLGTFTEELRNAGGTAEEMAGIMNSGVQGSLNGLKSALEGLLIAIAESGLLEAVAGFANWLAEIIRAAAATNPQLLGIVVGLGALLAAVGPVLLIGGKLVGMYGTLIVGALRLARSGMVTTAAAYVAHAARMAVSVVAAIGRVIVSLTLWAARTVAHGAIALASMVATAARYVAAWVLMAAGATARAAVMAAAWLIAMGPVGWVIAAVIGLVALIIANWNTVVGWTEAAWSAVSAAVGVAVDWLVGHVDNGIATVQGILGWLGGLPGMVGGWFAGAASSAGAAIGTLIGWVAGIPGRVLGALGNLGSTLWNSGSALISGFWDGLVARWNQLMSWVRGAMGNLRALWPFSPAKDGPFSGSGYVTHSGKALTGDFADSIRKGMPGVIDSARQMAAKARGAMQVPALDSRGAMGGGQFSGADDAAFAEAVRRRGGGGAGGGMAVTFNVHNPIAERSSATGARVMQTKAQMGAFSI